MSFINAATSTKILPEFRVKTGLRNNIKMITVTYHDVAPKAFPPLTAWTKRS